MQEGIYAVAEILPDALLIGGLGEHSVEDKDLAALGHIDGETRWGCDMDHGSLEALGNQFIARIAGFQRGPHTDGWNVTDIQQCAGMEGFWAHSPTLTAVLLSSSEARLPLGRLPVLMRLLLRGERMTALMGLVGMPGGGEPGGDIAISLGALHEQPPRKASGWI